MNVDSNQNACIIWKQHKFLKSLYNEIQSDKGWESVKKDLNDLRSILTNPNNLKMHMSADLYMLYKIEPNAMYMLEQILPRHVIWSNT